MSEPTSTVGGVAIATGAITLTGSIFGLQYDSLLCGLFGGLIALMHLEMGSRCKTAMTLLSSSLGAAMFAPVAVAAGLNYLEWMDKINPTALRLATAGALGLFGQVLIPLAMGFFQSKTAQLRQP